MNTSPQTPSSGRTRSAVLWSVIGVVIVGVGFAYWPLALYPMQARSPTVATRRIILLEQETENPVLMIEATQSDGVVVRMRQSDGSWKERPLEVLIQDK
jgi:hypothetical protein